MLCSLNTFPQFCLYYYGLKSVINLSLAKLTSKRAIGVSCLTYTFIYYNGKLHTQSELKSAQPQKS
jgi:hypothetical protein